MTEAEMLEKLEKWERTLELLSRSRQVAWTGELADLHADVRETWLTLLRKGTT